MTSNHPTPEVRETRRTSTTTTTTEMTTDYNDTTTATTTTIPSTTPKQPDEFMVSLVSYTSVPIDTKWLKKMIVLDDDTILLQTLDYVYHVSQATGEILNFKWLKNEWKANDVLTLWDQESVVVCTREYPSYVAQNEVLYLWNFRAGGDGREGQVETKPLTTVEFRGDTIQSMETLRLGDDNEKCIAVGLISEVRLMKVPSFDIIHTVSCPSAQSFRRILQLNHQQALGYDGLSFVAGSSNGLVIRWYSDHSNNNTNNNNKNLSNSNNNCLENSMQE